MQFPFSFWKVPASNGPKPFINTLGDFNFIYLGQPFVYGPVDSLIAEDGLDFNLAGLPFANWYNS